MDLLRTLMAILSTRINLSDTSLARDASERSKLLEIMKVELFGRELLLDITLHYLLMKLVGYVA